MLSNEEFRSLITALGTSIDENFNLANLKYNKVIILSDADQDGAHIRAILLTFFFRYMKELVTGGHVYIGMPPLYKVQKGSKVLYAYDDKELAKCIKEAGKGYTLQRYKGLGEMNPEQLWATTMDPSQRKLMQVTIEDAALADRRITILMGDKVEPRRDYIIENADFNKPDNFELPEGQRGEGKYVWQRKQAITAPIPKDDPSRILQTTVEDVMHQSMIPYAEHVILERALPRVEDGLKPVQRAFSIP